MEIGEDGYVKGVVLSEVQARFVGIEIEGGIMVVTRVVVEV